MTIAEILAENTLTMLERELILSHVLKQERTWLIAHTDKTLEPSMIEAYRILVKRRRTHEPIAFILGEKEFYGRTFKVNEHTLIPRPSTEGLIDLVFDFLETQETCVREVDTGIVCIAQKLGDLKDVQTIVDVGTGSGCIAITLACELPKYEFIATDVSDDALKIAKENAIEHEVDDRIVFRNGDGLAPVIDITIPFLLVSNPPYIPDGEPLPKEVDNFEPNKALYAGKDGLDVLMPMIADAHKNTYCRGYVIECRREQVSSLL